MSERAGSDKGSDLEESKKFIIQVLRRCMSDPFLSDIDFQSKMAWTTQTSNLLFETQKSKKLSIASFGLFSE